MTDLTDLTVIAKNARRFCGGVLGQASLLDMRFALHARIVRLERHAFGFEPKNYVCATCNVLFENGETVSVQNGGSYHARCLPPR